MELNTSSIWFLLFRWIDALLHPSAGVLVAIVVVAWTILSPDSLRGFWMVAQQQGVVVACWEVVWTVWDTLRAYTHMALEWVRWDEDGALRPTATATRRATKRRPPPPLVVLNKSSSANNNNSSNNNNNKETTSSSTRKISTPLNASSGSTHSHTHATNGNSHKPTKQSSSTSAATATTSKSNSLSNSSHHTSSNSNTNNGNTNISSSSIHSSSIQNNNNSVNHNGTTVTAPPNTDSFHSWETEEIEPAFLNADDYPPGWLVYHPILGVVSKEEADQYVDQQEQQQQQQQQHAPEGVTAM